LFGSISGMQRSRRRERQGRDQSLDVFHS
jgi:hypothetical protein